MQEIRLGASGLWTDPSELEAPKGALREALNVRIRRENCIEPRPGFPQETLDDANGPVTHMREWASGILSVVGTELWHLIPGGAVTEVTDAASAPLAITAAESTIAEVADVALVPTDTGVYAVDRDLNAYPAAVEKARPPIPTLGTGNVLNDDQQCALRSVVVQEVESGRLVFSAPSDPVTAINETGGSQGVTVRVALGPDVVAGMRVHVYRTDIVAVGTPPGDEMHLIRDVTLVAGDITAGYVDVALSASDELGASLYTNETQEGILQANGETPRAKRIAWYKQIAFYGDIRPRYDYRLEVAPTANGGIAAGATGTATSGSSTITGLPGGHGIPVGAYVSLSDDVGADDATFSAHTRVTVSGATTLTIDKPAIGNYTGAINFHDVLTVDGAEHIIGLTDALSSGQFGSITALCALINAAGGDTVATVLQEATFPRFVIESPGAFNVSSLFSGALGVFSSTPTAAVTNDELYPARLMWSKSLQPESVPAVNYIDIGKQWEPILGLGVTRDALFVLKADGVWRVSGDTPETLRVDEYDRSIQAIHPLAITTLDDQVWAWTTSGVVALSDGGTQRVSDPSIANLLEAAQSYVLTQGRAGTYVSGVFMGAAQQESVLMLGVPDPDDEEETPAAQYVYVLEAKTGAWVRWSSSHAWHSAGEYAGSIVIGGVEAIGVQSAALHDAVDTGVATRVEWVALVAGDPSSLAHWRGVKLLMADASTCSGFTVGFASERVPTEGTITLATTSSTRPVVLRGSPTRNHARCQRLRVSAASSLLDQAWRMEALALTFEQMRGGERMP